MRLKTKFLLLFTCFLFIKGNAQIEFQFHLVADDINSANSAFVTDLDGDGDMDVITSAYDIDQVVWIENLDGAGTYGPPHIVTDDIFNPSLTLGIDMDTDGDKDIVLVRNGNKIAWYENMDGLGNFNPQENVVADLVGIGQVVSILAADLDGDGDTDIAYGGYGGSFNISWFENEDGQGNFGSEQILTSYVDSDGGAYIHAADLDSDGDMDILVSTSGDNNVTWYQNIDGQGSYELGQMLATNAFETEVVIAADLDGDGDVDVISGSKSGAQDLGYIRWYENIDGQGTFGEQQGIESSTISNPELLLASDLDGDEDLDLVYANVTFAGDIGWFENLDGAGTFSEEQEIVANPNGTRHIFTADLEGDGDLDLFYSSFWSDRVVCFKNVGILGNQIEGKVHHDINADDCATLGYPISNIMVKTSNGNDEFSILSQNGEYSLNTNTGFYTTTIATTLPDYFTVNPESQSIFFSDLGNTNISDFCVEANQTVNDLSIDIYPTTAARPGFDANYSITYKNVGTTKLNGDLTFSFDDTKLSFLSASETIASQSNNQLVFDYADLEAFETRTINLVFNVFQPPIVEINEVLNFNASINPTIGDNTEIDNQSSYEQITVGSFDPNDITVLEGAEVSIDDAGKFLHYVIRFQNTGTAHAVKVKVDNVLDPNLDWETFQFGTSSHDCRVEIMNGNEMSFIFDGIYLPDSTNNEPESHGFVTYKIKPQSSVTVGSVISNQASIFFDFNEAIETNIATTQFVIPSSIAETNNLEFSVYPIPSSDVLTIESESFFERIEIYNSRGTLTLISTDQSKIDISHLNQGVYFCKVIDDYGNSAIKKVIKN